MIVIAIIGILAAIAIPNYIAYRNKSYCSAAESDANAIASALADYFAIPSHIYKPTVTQLGVTLSRNGNPDANTATIIGGGGTVNANTAITITVTDQSKNCPLDTYQAQNPDWTNYVYTKVMK